MNSRISLINLSEDILHRRLGDVTPMDIVRRLIDELGLMHVCYYASGVTESPIPVYMGTYPVKWMDIYQERGYYFIDPVIQRAVSMRAPLAWDTMTGLSDDQRAFMETSKGYIGRNGLTIPLGADPVVAGINITSNEPEDVWRARMPNVCWNVMMAGQRIHNIVLADRRAQEKLEELTEAQQVCLGYLAMGMDLVEIARISDMPEATVRRNLDEAQRRLSAHSHSQAVAKAATLGHIDL